MKLLHVLEMHHELGEGILWDHRSQRALWTDIHARRLYYWHPGKSPVAVETPDRLGSFGLTDNPGQLICAFARGFALFDIETQTTKWLYDIDTCDNTLRLNDGKVDRQGRFWAGSLREHGKGTLGAIYQLAADGPRRHVDNIHISNSLCFSLAGDSMYYADSMQQVIWKAQLDTDSGAPLGARVFARTYGNAHPDGSCIDSEDCVWNAQWGAANVIRYTPHGDVAQTLSLPCVQPTCVALGGPQLNWLMVTSANEGLSARQRHPSGGDGNVFIYEIDVRGVEEPVCSIRQRD